MKTIITLQSSWMSGSEEWQVRFRYDETIIGLLRQIKGAHWSPEGRCWIVPGGKAYEDYLVQLLSAYELDWYREPPMSDARKSAIAAHASQTKFQTTAAQEFYNWMLQRRYSLNTIKVYAQSVDFFLRSILPKKSTEVIAADVELFLRNAVVEKGLSTAYQRQLINSIKLFYSKFLRTGLQTELLVLPRKDRKLPKVISPVEVQKILQAVVNQKHRTALLLLYACGLRRSELLQLTLSDVDSVRELLHVRQSKGRKDRYVPLPKKLVEALRDYYKRYRPQHYLFEGQAGGGTAWSAKSLEQVLRRAVEHSGINRHVNLHMLRHSYATHQLEAGVNLRYIQEILGHSSPVTTQIYTHVTAESVRKISSPAERLDIW